MASGATWIRGYWGKARMPEGARHAWHPLVWHSLDVAACAEALLEARPALGAALVRAIGRGTGDAEREGARALATLLALAHDVGKFADGFQSLAPDVCAAIGSEPADAASRGAWRHDNVGLLALLDGGLGEVVLGEDVEPFDVLPKLASAAACHHGRPTDIRAIEGTTTPAIVKGRSLADARAFLCEAARMVGGHPLLPKDASAAARASMILAGIVNVADWLGSNAPYASPDHDIDRYWRYARRAARRTVRRASLIAAIPRANADFAGLYPDKRPTPLQAIADALRLPDGPTLVVIEEAAGGGKTEAAMTLAARMLAAGKGGGVYLALPTTATADAQAARQMEIASLLFEGKAAAPSVMVAHSGAADGILLETDRERLAWLADDRRRRLLADVCVGTVDQALLAALPSRFAAVRIMGLVDKVLVVDEAHAYDAYTGTLLAALLRLHAALGGSAILLSATLPRDTKAAMAAAFAAGARLPLPEPEAIGAEDYPLVTVVSGDGTALARPAPARRAPSDKEIAFVRSEAEAEETILAAARDGLCVAWVRNTVDQSIGSGRSLLARHTDVTVLHSRFPETDRTRVTKDILRRFGRASRAEDRRAGVVVATAVIEQSLDLDFDLVVVDLKPIECIVQTLGRARRHSRDRWGNPLPDGAPDERPHRPMLVLAPDHRERLDEAWYRRLLGKADFIHRDTGVLWRTAEVLARFGWVRYSHARQLVEEVRSPRLGANETPGCFSGASERAMGEGFADASVARNVLRDWGAEKGYEHSGVTWDDERVPTRLGDSVEVVLVRLSDKGKAHPYEVGEGWTSGRLRLRVPQAARLPALEDEAVTPGLARACPHTKAVVIPSDGATFKVTAFAGLEWNTEVEVSPE